MDASRTHEATHEQSLWSWVVIGAVLLAFAVAIIVWQGTADDGVVVRAPAPAVAQVDPVTKDDFLHGRGSGDAQVGTTTNVAPAGVATDIREGGAYYGTEAVVTTPRRGLCATKAGC